jgi:hypothetical protein
MVFFALAPGLWADTDSIGFFEATDASTNDSFAGFGCAGSGSDSLVLLDFDVLSPDCLIVIVVVIVVVAAAAAAITASACCASIFSLSARLVFCNFGFAFGAGWVGVCPLAGAV